MSTAEDKPNSKSNIYVIMAVGFVVALILWVVFFKEEKLIASSADDAIKIANAKVAADALKIANAKVAAEAKATNDKAVAQQKLLDIQKKIAETSSINERKRLELEESKRIADVEASEAARVKAAEDARIFLIRPGVWRKGFVYGQKDTSFNKVLNIECKDSKGRNCQYPTDAYKCVEEAKKLGHKYVSVIPYGESVNCSVYSDVADKDKFNEGDVVDPDTLSLPYTGNLHYVVP
jgi:hypothetical protein